MIRFVGGPYDGQSFPDEKAYFIAGNYNVTHTASKYIGVSDTQMDFEYVGAGPGAVAVIGTSSHKGWSDLRHSVNRALPTAMVRSGRMRRAAWRKLHRLHAAR